MPEPAPIRPGLYAALATRLGTFVDVDEVRPEVQDGATGFFVHRVGADAVVLARGFGVFRGNERTRELAAIPPPAALDGPDDAIGYGRRLAAIIAEKGWDLCLALALLRPSATGIAGWIVGGVQVFCIDPSGPLGPLDPLSSDGGFVLPCSPPQTLQVPPGVELPPGLDPARLLVSGVTSTLGGGDWFEAPGRRFAIFLLPPPFTLTRAALGDVAAAGPQHLLQRLGAIAIEREVALVADWSMPAAAPRERDTQDLPPYIRRWSRTGADLSVEVQAGKQTHSGGLARATVRFTPIAPGSPVSVESALSEEALPVLLYEALQKGITEAAARDGVTGFRAVVEAALVHPIDATVEKFRAAGALSIEALGRLRGRG